LTSEGAPENSSETLKKVEEGGVQDRDIVDEMRTSYLNYSMSVIVGRALPDARDGLKPVHRRILHSMNEGGMVAGKSYKKSARVVGDVLGKYHPHGDSAVYDALVRMAQDFSLRYPLIDGQGNFGSVDGDSAAAMRYTEARTTRIAMEMLADIDKDTVDMVPNYDGSLKEPVVLPTKLPNLLLNGSSGIAVGMATNMPPHNLNEIVEGLKALLDNPDIELLELMEHIMAPDFPTGGTIYGKNGIYQAYATGRGKITLRANAEIEEMKNGRSRIVVSEIPYMVNKSNMLQKIAELVKARVFEDISDIRDESDKDGLRVVFELRKDAVPEVTLNRLYAHSDLQTTFGVINLALVDGQPRVMSLKELLEIFLDHRREVIRKRTEHDLRKAMERIHLLEGLIVALDNIERVISIIRGSKDPQVAMSALTEEFSLTEVQAKAILDMKLQRLTSLEMDSIRREASELEKTIADYRDILERSERIDGIIREELDYLKERYGDERRTLVEENAEEIDIEDLIVKRDITVTITNTGYIKRMDLDTYRTQNRGGKGLKGLSMKEEDFVVDMFICSSHDHILFFTSKGKVFWLKGYNIPTGTRQARGKPIVNLLPNLEENEVVMSTLHVSDFDEGKYLIFCTKRGLVKRTVLNAYSRPRTTGIKAILLNEGDELVDTQLCTDGDEVALSTALGMTNRFKVSDVRPMGRVTAGVRGMRLKYKGDRVISMAVLPPSPDEEPFEEEMEEGEPEDEEELLSVKGPVLLTITQKGFGKRAPAWNYRLTRRGAGGVTNIRREQIKETGEVVKVMMEREESEVLMVSQSGMVIRTPSSSIRMVNRVGKGVIVMRLNGDDIIKAVAMIQKIEDENGSSESESDEEPPKQEKDESTS